MRGVVLLAVLSAVLVDGASLGVLLAGPAATAPASQPAGPETAPSLDTCRIVGVLPPATKVVSVGPGRVAIAREQWIDHDDARTRRWSEPLAPGVVRPALRSHPDAVGDSPGRFQGIGADGRAWYFGWNDDGTKIEVTCVHGGKASTFALGGGCRLEFDERSPHWPWRGEHVLGDPDGGVWVLTPKSLVHIPSGPDGKRQEYPFPTPADATRAQQLFGQADSPGEYSHALYRFGDEIWVLRQNRSGHGAMTAWAIRLADGRCTIAARLPGQIVLGMLRHKGDVYLMLGRYCRSSRRDRSPWTGKLLRVSRPIPALAPAELRKVIADCDAQKHKTREDASKVLVSLPRSQLDDLRQALAAGGSAERQFRLQAAIKAIESPDPRLEDATLGGFDRLDPLYIDSQGRQYLRPCGKDGEALAKLLIVGPEELRGVDLPSAGGVSVCQGEDQRIYVMDDDAIHVLDGATGRLRRVARTSPGAHARLLAVRRGPVAIVSILAEIGDAVLCLDLSEPASAPVLPGREVYSGVQANHNYRDPDSDPIAVGPSGRLWFLGKRPAASSSNRASTVQLCRAEAGRVVELGGSVSASWHLSTWPIGPDTALVVSVVGEEGRAIWYHNGTVQGVEGNLYEIVEAHPKTILEQLPDGAAFLSPGLFGELVLLRAGDCLYAQDTILTNTKAYSRSGIRDEWEWSISRRARLRLGNEARTAILGDVVAIDPAGQRVLAYANRRRTLQWISMPDMNNIKELAAHAAPWTWGNQTSRPRFGGRWTLSREAAQAWHKRVAQAAQAGHDDPWEVAPIHSQDLRGVRRFVGDRWRVLNHSLYGAVVWEDSAGGVWQFRTGEVLVSQESGDQLIPLPGGGNPGDYRLAVESKEAVWIASLTDLTRFVRVRDADGKARWTPRERFRLPALGVQFAGPWIAGTHLYYVSRGRLYGVRLDELTAGRKAGRVDAR